VHWGEASSGGGPGGEGATQEGLVVKGHSEQLPEREAGGGRQDPRTRSA